MFDVTGRTDVDDGPQRGEPRRADPCLAAVASRAAVFSASPAARWVSVSWSELLLRAGAASGIATVRIGVSIVVTAHSMSWQDLLLGRYLRPLPCREGDRPTRCEPTDTSTILPNYAYVTRPLGGVELSLSVSLGPLPRSSASRPWARGRANLAGGSRLWICRPDAATGHATAARYGRASRKYLCRFSQHDRRGVS
jgi:hypothetical protein